jgi:curved DNA-binding protein CbpA
MSQEVNRAYQVLADPERRDVYDRLGEEGVRKMKPEDDEDEESRNERDEERSSEGETNNEQREGANGDASKKRTEKERDDNFYQETNDNLSFYTCKYYISSLSVLIFVCKQNHELLFVYDCFKHNTIQFLKNKFAHKYF